MAPAYCSGGGKPELNKLPLAMELRFFVRRTARLLQSLGPVEAGVKLTHSLKIGAEYGKDTSARPRSKPH
jgi:hypothetical protein